MTITEYEAKRINSKPAQARVSGILRGGFLVDDEFYYFSMQPERTTRYTELEIF